MVDDDALDAFFQVEVVEIVESHEMAVSSEDEHLVAEDVDWLSIAGAWFFADDEAVGFVVDDFLADFVFIVFLYAWVGEGVPMVSRVLSMDSVVGESERLDLVVGCSSNCFRSSFFR